MTRETLGRVGIVALPVVLVMASSSRTQAQAWVPEEGQASISFFYTHGDVRYHLFSGDFNASGVYKGKRRDLGALQSHSMHIALDYGVSSNVALSASIPAIVSRYDGIRPDNEAVDDGLFRGGFQDFEFKVRYMSVQSPLVVTPFMSVVIPSHDYETFGHTAIGRDLMELHFGFYLGKLLTFISDNLYTQVGYDFAYVEKHHDVRVNRSNIDLTLGYFVTPSVTVSTSMSYLKSHGGIDWLDIHNQADLHEHDRHAAANYLALGGLVSVALNDALNFFVGYSGILWGENTHEIRTVAIGSNWTLQIRE